MFSTDNNKEREEGKVNSKQQAHPSKENPNGVTREYATYYVLFKGKK